MIDERTDAPLQVRSQRSGSVLTVVLDGELDLTTVVAVVNLVDEITDDVDGVVVELARLTFCDSTGLTAFVRLLNRSAEVGARFELNAPLPIIREALRATGLDQILTITD
jgi:anti-sigma B factor antagonist